MTNSQMILIIAICGIVTFALRAIPFLILAGREVPKSITYLGKVLPMSVMTILVVYCVKGVRFDSPDNFVPTLVGLIVTAFLHLWKKNTFLSIVAGTVIYMLMVQLVF